MSFSTLFFDLDATLYPASSGLWEVLKGRIHNFMVERVGLPEERVHQLRQTYSRKYGTTLSGLMRHHQVDPDEYLAYVHDIPLEDYISFSPELKVILSSLPQPLWVITNADRDHARKVLELLQLDQTFSGIADIHALHFQVKPDPRAYQRALDMAGADSPDRCVIFDDLAQNLPPAKELGFYTVLVHAHASDHPADQRIQSLLDLPQEMPFLWKRG